MNANANKYLISPYHTHIVLAIHFHNMKRLVRHLKTCETFTDQSQDGNRCFPENSTLDYLCFALVLNCPLYKVRFLISLIFS